jgi:hypothetical protein
MYLAGFEPGISSRSWATLKRVHPADHILVQVDLELIMFDFVAWNNVSSCGVSD